MRKTRTPYRTPRNEGMRVRRGVEEAFLFSLVVSTEAPLRFLGHGETTADGYL